MFKTFFQNHQYKLILGAPIIFLIVINSTGTLGVGNIFFFANDASNFLVVGEERAITLTLEAKSPINAAGGTIAFTPEILTLTSLSRLSSVIDLWSEEPSYTPTDNTLKFSGGMIGEKNTLPVSGAVFVMNVRAQKEGTAVVTLRDGQLLANNGEGTNILSGSNTLTLYVRNANTPSPDINSDGVLSVADANTLYLKTFRTYDASYDLNIDGKVSWGDVRTLLKLF